MDRFPAAAAAPLNRAEFMALLSALSQYVENGRSNDSVEDPYESDPHLGPAEAILNRMNTQLTLLAEMH